MMNHDGALLRSPTRQTWMWGVERLVRGSRDGTQGAGT
jgi:hypothetical protein